MEDRGRRRREAAALSAEGAPWPLGGVRTGESGRTGIGSLLVALGPGPWASGVRCLLGPGRGETTPEPTEAQARCSGPSPPCSDTGVYDELGADGSCSADWR